MWTAVAIVALKAATYTHTKKDCVQLYRKYINDGWTELVEETNERCVNQWAYLIPQKKDERMYLRGLCRKALEFENHFLTVYKRYLFSELTNNNKQIQSFASKRLESIGTLERECPHFNINVINA